VDIFTVPHAHRVMVRFVDPDHPEHVKVTKGDIPAVVEFYGLAIGAFAALLFELEGVNFPVGHVGEAGFIAYMVFERHGVDLSRSGGVAHVESA